MKTYICEVCGDAYLGDAKPKNCPFCGTDEVYIKDGNEADPIVNGEYKIDEITKKNLETTLALELNATALYICMAGKAKTYEIKAMYKRLSKVEKEHASIARKILKLDSMEVPERNCDEEMEENFKKTIVSEKNAVSLYDKFSDEASEPRIKILFKAIANVEREHINLIDNYLS
jgi:rubrerythrin